ncbi:MAG: putative toxin-antitoxin system toxin component, PIN family [Caldilineales bacterium]|nr:putative toxin-antitoxin system toxin component, PIN family [Caldilineales bacterium]MCW5857527.1 putative toxin-antitoxin system toxin component, PIN family [Caldilineales bacterium]
MNEPQIVIDTSVLVAGLRSSRGASFRVLELVGAGRFDINVSVPLVFEYEATLYRELPHLQVSKTAVDTILDFHCAIAHRHAIFFLWRPFLSDAKDDMILELAVKAQCSYIVTHNKRHFLGVEQFNLSAVTPAEFLILIGEAK